MNIRSTELKELPLVMEIYDCARNFMRTTGNTTQWVNGYPSEAFIRQEIEEGHSFVCADEQGVISGTFCFILGDDPTYQHIYEGAWLNDEPYGVVHRLATNGIRKGVAAACLDWSFNGCRMSGWIHIGIIRSCSISWRNMGFSVAVSSM